MPGDTKSSGKVTWTRLLRDHPDLAQKVKADPGLQKGIRAFVETFGEVEVVPSRVS